jgi:hypothetical protein
MVRNVRLAMTVGAILSLPSAAAGQACLGIPTNDGSVAIIGSFATTNGAKAYGGTVHGNLVGPISLQAGYSLIDVDDVDANVNSFHAGVAAELPSLSFSACPFAGAEYSTWSESGFGVDVDFTQTVIPVGLGIGKQFAAGPTMGFTIFATPQFMYIRAKLSVTDGIDSISETESSSEFGLGFGFRLGNSSVFGGGGVSFTSIEDSDPVFNVSLGFAVGGTR